jgi:hypothetical protein
MAKSIRIAVRFWSLWNIFIEPERAAEFARAMQYITGASWQRSAGDFWQREELPIKHMILPLGPER